jgi:chorismate mutase
MKKSRFASTDKILIAGPCAAESLEQLHSVAKSLSLYEGLIFRAGLWKPRTRPGRLIRASRLKGYETGLK